MSDLTDRPVLAPRPRHPEAPGLGPGGVAHLESPLATHDRTETGPTRG